MYIHDSNFKRTKNERKHCTQSVLSSPLPTDTQFSVPQTTNVINFLCILLVRVCAYANIFLPSFLPTLPPLPLSFFKDHPSQPSDVGLAPINHQLLIVWHILLVKLCWSYASGINSNSVLKCHLIYTHLMQYFTQFVTHQVTKLA